MVHALENDDCKGRTPLGMNAGDFFGMPLEQLAQFALNAARARDASRFQALRHEKVFKDLANLLVEEVYRQLQEKINDKA